MHLDFTPAWAPFDPRPAFVPRRHVVLWSGGFDSTAILGGLLENRQRLPVTALAVAAHPQLDANQLEAQRRARVAFGARAAARKESFQHVELALGVQDSARPRRRRLGARDVVFNPVSVTGVNPQATLWFSLVMPYVEDGDLVHMGYIRGDDFWHERAAFEAAFHAVCAMKRIDARLCYPLAMCTKVDVVRALRDSKIPPTCVWTCDRPQGTSGDCGPKALRAARKVRTIRPCGECGKCRDALAACAELPPRMVIRHPPKGGLMSKKPASDKTASRTVWKLLSKLAAPVEKVGPPVRFKW